MPDRLLRRNQVQALVGLSKSGIYARIKEGTFPAPVKLGGRAVAWSERAVQEWIEARLAEAKGAA